MMRHPQGRIANTIPEGILINTRTFSCQFIWEFYEMSFHLFYAIAKCAAYISDNLVFDCDIRILTDTYPMR